jgi:hypothetical protein
MILKVENFFGVTTSNVDLIAKYQASVDFNSTTYTRWPTNSRGMQIYTGGLGATYFYFGVPARTFIYTGFAFNHVIANAEGILASFRNNGTTHVNFGISPGGLVTARLAGSTTIFTYNIPNYSLNTWYSMEFGLVVADTSGSVEFRVNGQSRVSMSNIDTKNGTTNTVDEIGTESFRQNNLWYMTDWYMTDNSGSNASTNGFLGDIRIISTIPSQSGDQTDFIPSASTNVSQVDDGNAPDNDTTYVSQSVQGSTDLYKAFPYTGSLTNIYGVSVRTLARKVDAGTRQFVNVLKSGSNLSYSPTQSLGTSYAYYTDVFENNPNTGLPFTSVNDVNNSQFGFTIVT